MDRFGIEFGLLHIGGSLSISWWSLLRFLLTLTLRCFLVLSLESLYVTGAFTGAEAVFFLDWNQFGRERPLTSMFTEIAHIIVTIF